MIRRTKPFNPLTKWIKFQMWNKKNCFTRKKHTNTNVFHLLLLLFSLLHIHPEILAGKCMGKCANVQYIVRIILVVQCAEANKVRTEHVFFFWQNDNRLSFPHLEGNIC